MVLHMSEVSYLVGPRRGSRRRDGETHKGRSSPASATARSTSPSASSWPACVCSETSPCTRRRIFADRDGKAKGWVMDETERVGDGEGSAGGIVQVRDDVERFFLCWSMKSMPSRGKMKVGARMENLHDLRRSVSTLSRRSGPVT